MARNLYETLSVPKDAPADEIRRVYRKAALQTHPDRLPAGSTEKDKERAEEQFRTVNNAYEVLSDEEKRRLYDRHGQWPPPEAQQDPYADRTHHHRHHEHGPHARTQRHGFDDPFGDAHPFNEPFSTHPFGASALRSRPRNNTYPEFTDPFTNAQWASQSRMTRSMNGVTEIVWNLPYPLLRKHQSNIRSSDSPRFSTFRTIDDFFRPY